MKYLSVAEIAQKWGISERSVRNYCAGGRIDGAFLTGKTWNIPEDAQKPERSNGKGGNNLLTILNREREAKLSGGIYHKVQIELTYNSNHIEGSRLSQEQTRFIFESNTIGVTDESVNVDDVIETSNHFRCIDYCIENANRALSETMIKTLHGLLKAGTSDSRKSWFNVGEYKKLPNEVGGNETAAPELVHGKLAELIKLYNALESVTLRDIIAFHVSFGRIHPFQDGNGRVGRLIMFKECLKHNIVPFIIDEYHKLFYYRGLREWGSEEGYLIETCRSVQNQFKRYLDYFKIPYNND